MNVMRHCEVCEQPIPDGQEVVHPEDGDSYCARCVVDLIGGERDALTRQLAGAVSDIRVLRAALIAVRDTAHDDERARTVDEALSTVKRGQ
jgi:hypothetical protein